MRPTALHLAAFAFCGFASAARAEDTPLFHFIDRDLVRISGELVGLSDKTVQYRDASGRPRSLDRSKLLAAYTRRHHGPAVPTSLSVADAPGEIPGVLRLADGQLVPGFLLTAGATDANSKADDIRWRSRRVGPFVAPLDNVVAIALNDAPRPLEASRSDLVLLTNADRLEGFVESIRSELTIEVGGKKSTLPMERVSWIQLSAKPATASSQLVHLTDGSILAAKSVVSSGTGLTVAWSLAGDDATGVLDLGAIDAIVFEPAALRPLAACEIVKQEPLQSRRWAPPITTQPIDDAPIGLAAITLDGPMACEWRLPAGAKRLRATISLPEAARAWGNTTVTAATAPRSGAFGKPQTFELSGEKPEAELSLDCTGAERLRIEVLGRGYDQVQARAVLLEPAILIAK